ncbi:hypothetical protein B0H12DRAFT_1106232 [Mycena haematopus]|nr:hypothetical protein B0H12DRAFT_1106232 [Mycena haematopus]
MPIYPQKAALHLFVERSMDDLPEFFSLCRENTELLHHLQRYAACYVAYKAGYFSDALGSNTIKILPRIKILPPKLRLGTETIAPGSSRSKSMDLSESGLTVIKAFLAGCHPPMSHLFENFRRAHITGEIHLQGMARWTREELRDYLMSSGITKTMLEAQAIVEAFVRKKYEG